MIWCKKFYCGESAEADAEKIIKSIKRKKPIANSYVITLPVYGNNLLDIFEAKDIFKPFNGTKDCVIVGIAMGKEEAMLLSGSIIDEVYKATGGFAVADYLKQG